MGLILRRFVGRSVLSVTHSAFIAAPLRYRYVVMALTILPLGLATFGYFEDGPVLLRADSRLHYAFALASAVVFLFSLFMFLERAGTSLRMLAITGAFTGTLGIIFLFVVQRLAADSGEWQVWGTGSGALFHYLLRMIAYSYSAAENPFNGFMPSLLGFIFGVGLCEEFVKALPLLWGIEQHHIRRWEEACVIGFASGVGFGVAEGILYSADSYNGSAPAAAYVIRFVSCVGGHAFLTATAGLLLHRANIFDTGWAYLVRVVWVLLPVMTLHGLYDTLLKRDMPLLALGVDVGSFLFFAFQIEAARCFALPVFRRRRRSRPAVISERMLPPLSAEEMAEVDRVLERVYCDGVASVNESEKSFVREAGFRPRPA